MSRGALGQEDRHRYRIYCYRRIRRVRTTGSGNRRQDVAQGATELRCSGFAESGCLGHTRILSAANQNCQGLATPAGAVTVPPSLGGAPSTRLPGLSWVAAMIVANNLLGILQVAGRDLGWFVVASPLHQVLQAWAASSAAAVQAGV